MQNPIHLSESQAEQLLNTLSRQLNTDPHVLKQQLQSGNFQQLSQSMGSESVQQLQQLLKDPKQLQQVMNSPQMQQLLRSFKSR